VTLSTKIVELGGKLSELRTARDALNTQIQGLEKELLPLVAKHGELMAALLGQALPVAVAPAALEASPAVADSSASLSATTKKRVIEFLKRQDTSEGGISAMEIAEALKIDVSSVRECMLEMRTGR